MNHGTVIRNLRNRLGDDQVGHVRVDNSDRVLFFERSSIGFDAQVGDRVQFRVDGTEATQLRMLSPIRDARRTAALTNLVANAVFDKIKRQPFWA